MIFLKFAKLLRQRVVHQVLAIILVGWNGLAVAEGPDPIEELVRAHELHVLATNVEEFDMRRLPLWEYLVCTELARDGFVCKPSEKWPYKNIVESIEVISVASEGGSGFRQPVSRIRVKLLVGASLRAEDFVSTYLARWAVAAWLPPPAHVPFCKNTYGLVSSEHGQEAYVSMERLHSYCGSHTAVFYISVFKRYRGN